MKICYCLILTIFSSYTYCYQIDQIQDGDTLYELAKRNHQKVLPRYEDFNLYMQEIKTWNPRVNDWNNLEPGNYVFVDYPYDIPKYVIQSKLFTKSPYEIYSDEIGPKKFTTYLSLTSSSGSYREEFTEANVKSTQNFPITLGMSFSFKLQENLKYILSSFYYAYSTKANITFNQTNKESKIPGEFGLNLYYQRFFFNNYALYGGIDIEKLNTINTLDVINNDADIIATQYNVFYATIGLSKNFNFNKIPMGLKGSVSQLISSTTVNSTKLSGYKYILFYSIRPIGKVNFNIFYKHHNLEGPSALQINRIGLGISIMF